MCGMQKMGIQTLSELMMLNVWVRAHTRSCSHAQMRNFAWKHTPTNYTHFHYFSSHGGQWCSTVAPLPRHTHRHTHTPPPGPEHRINASQAATAARFSRFLEICLYCIFPWIFSSTRRTPQKRVKSSFLALRRLQKENHPPQAGGSKESLCRQLC